MKTLKTTAPLPYYGTDAGVSQEISAIFNSSGIRHLTNHTVGGGAIIRYITCRMLCNDLNDWAINYYRVLKSDTDELVRRCDCLLSHPRELADAMVVLNSFKARTPDVRDEVKGLFDEEPVEIPEWTPMTRAVAYFAVCWIGRKGAAGTGNEGGSISFRRSADGGSNASRLEAAKTDQLIWANHFKRCEFICEDARQTLRDGKNHKQCGHYIDMPWVAEGKYQHGPNVKDEAEVRQFHTSIRDAANRYDESPILIRYGDHPLIRELYPESDWTWVSAESRTQSNTVRDEVWITRNLT